MTRLAFDEVSAGASVLATTKSTPCRPASIMLLTALPPAPATPNTIMRAFISRMSVMPVIFASRLLSQAGERGHGLLPASLAVCFHDGRGQMSQSACSLSVAVARSATGPQSRHLVFKPCRHLLGRHSLGSRLQQLNRQAIGALALTLEICSVIGCPGFEPRDRRLQ